MITLPHKSTHSGQCYMSCYDSLKMLESSSFEDAQYDLYASLNCLVNNLALLMYPFTPEMHPSTNCINII